ncbi:hydroxyacid dehydrogenase [[Clostridium] spiroforme]|nr:hydroxyacid dehydrogenase [Thomasclavelia spiroformis]MBM6881356.1 hydroxyacid dehydrogenase [Thomasclavelia spiroformis]
MKRKIFLCEQIHQQAYNLLKKNFKIVTDWDKLDQVEGLIVRNFRVDRKLIDCCQSLKVVAVHGTGYDHLDLSYLKSRGVTVFRVPGENAQSVAEFTVALMLNLSRNIYLADRCLQQGNEIELGTKQLEGTELFEKTVGLIGWGQIARKTAFILQMGFRMNVIVYSPSLTEKQALNDHIEKCETLKELFTRADIVSVHCSLNDQTRKLIHDDILRYAKSSCLLVNTARGKIIDEKALYKALKNGVIKGAACDVFSDEPISKSHPLLSLPQFLATPHIAATTDEALYRVGMKVVYGLIDYFEGKDMENRL